VDIPFPDLLWNTVSYYYYYIPIVLLCDSDIKGRHFDSASPSLLIKDDFVADQSVLITETVLFGWHSFPRRLLLMNL